MEKYIFIWGIQNPDDDYYEETYEDIVIANNEDEAFEITISREPFIMSHFEHLGKNRMADISQHYTHQEYMMFCEDYRLECKKKEYLESRGEYLDDKITLHEYIDSDLNLTTLHSHQKNIKV